MQLYALTIFLGAFLLFQVQPMIGKFILPWFGGGPGIWTTCMLFFQMLLLAGYGYAHFLGSGCKPRLQARIHGVVLVLALLTLPIIPADSWKPDGSAEPTMRILLLLLASVGLPYFVLSTTGPLLQRWFSLSHPGVSPYRLYALSNVGSLLALLTYPFVFEPALSRKAQAWMWSGGMIVFAALCGYCAWRLRESPAEKPAPAPGSGADEAEAQPPTLLRKLLWIALPAGASMMLLGTTNKMCQDVAVVPFLWVLPLSLYLLSFIISFDSPRWYSRRWYGAGMILAFAAITAAIYKSNDIPLSWQVFIYSSALFILCMCAHGELYRIRPHPRYLTTFYLMISAGGALGGLLVAVVAPLIFVDYYEFQIGLIGSGLVFIAAVWHTRAAVPLTAGGMTLRKLPGLPVKAFPVVFGLVLLTICPLALGCLLFGLDNDLIEKLREPVWNTINQLAGATVPTESLLNVCLIWGLALYVTAVWLGRYLAPIRRWLNMGMAVILVACILTSILLQQEVAEDRNKSIASARNFYGTLKVFEYNPGSDIDNYYLLQHGRITHGMQLRHPTYRNWPTTYYGEMSGVGKTIKHFPRQEGQRVAVVGLGTGSMAVHGKEGDYYRFYEINPAVTNIALNQFTHLTDSQAKIEIAMGDARLSMENEAPQQFDVIVLDAFSSDAIPVHLLTTESFALYRRHLKPDGVICVHISNRHLDLEPIVLMAADQLGWRAAIVENRDGDIGVDGDETNAWWVYTAIWVLVTANDELLDHSELAGLITPPKERTKPVRMWTDDYTALAELMEGSLIPGWDAVKRVINRTKTEDAE